jgi:hypothetical protein
LGKRQGFLGILFSRADLIRLRIAWRGEELCFEVARNFGEYTPIDPYFEHLAALLSSQFRKHKVGMPYGEIFSTSFSDAHLLGKVWTSAVNLLILNPVSRSWPPLSNVQNEVKKLEAQLQ